MKYNETAHMYQFTLPAFAYGTIYHYNNRRGSEYYNWDSSELYCGGATFVLNVNKIPIKPKINATCYQWASRPVQS